MKTLRILIAGLLALFALWLVLALSGWLPRIPADQRQALARLRSAPAPLPGRDATIEVWLIDRNVPEAEWARWLALPAAEAQARLAKLPATPGWPREYQACAGWGENCLARVAASTAVARALRDANAERLRRIEALQSENRHIARVGMPAYTTPYPPLGGLHAPVRLDAALRFLDGDRQGALERLCRHARWWRGLRRDTDLLLVSSVGTAVVTGAGQSYVEMLQALPAGESPPAACRDAFAPLADAELDLCRAMRDEFLRQTRALQQGIGGGPDPAPLRRLARHLAYRPEASEALLAPSYDYWCSAAQRERAAARAEARMTAPGRCRADGWLFNYVGCTFAPIAAPTLPGWYPRVLDLDGRLRLVRSAEWLLAQAPAETATAFAQRPVKLRDPRQALEGPRCRPVLRYLPRAGAPWRLPLPPPGDCGGEAAH